MATVLVTGATGFVGRHAATALEHRGAQVYRASRSHDLLNADARLRVIERARATHLLHLAWTTEHGRFWNDPQNLAWVSASLDLAQLFAAAGGKRLVFAGTCAEYDWSATGRLLVEKTSRRRPSSLYGLAKLATGDLLQEWGRITGVTVARGLLFFLYGPGEQRGRLVPSVVVPLLAGERVDTTDGKQVRDFLHVQDAGNALAALVLGDVTGPVNVASGKGHRVIDVISAIAEMIGRPELVDPGALPRTENEPPILVASTEILDTTVERPTPRNLRTGLAETIEWWRERLEGQPKRIT